MHLVRQYDMEYRPAHYGFGVAPPTGTRVVIARILPGLDATEVRIVAERAPGWWRYFIEGPPAWRLALGRVSSRDVLSFGELLELIGGATVGDGSRAYLLAPICSDHFQLDGGPSLAKQRANILHANDFPRPSSPCYPQLAACCADRHDEWVDRHLQTCAALRDEA